MDNLKQKVKTLISELENSAEKMNLDKKIVQLELLEEEISQPEIWNNPKYAQKKVQETNKLKNSVQPWRTLKTQLLDLLELMSLDDGELSEEFEQQFSSFEDDFKELKKQLLFSGEFDDHDATIRITSGVGGTDAQDFAQMLERMYLRWAEKNDFKAESIERSQGEEAGIKTSVIDISGDFVYGKLRSENGVHRLVRISPFGSGTRETSFALVEILPKIDEPDQIKIEDKDLRIDVYRSGGSGGQKVNKTDSAVRITHLPTNTVVAIQNERSQTQNKETAMRILRGKLAQMQLEQRADDLSELQAGKSAEWGAQIRNYVLNPYKLVKDVRTKYEEKDVDKVLNGGIDGFIYAFLENKG